MYVLVDWIEREEGHTRYLGCLASVYGCAFLCSLYKLLTTIYKPWDCLTLFESLDVSFLTPNPPGHLNRQFS